MTIMLNALTLLLHGLLRGKTLQDFPFRGFLLRQNFSHLQ